MVVAKDGSGNYTNVQAAIDAGNTALVEIFVKIRLMKQLHVLLNTACTGSGGKPEGRVKWLKQLTKQEADKITLPAIFGTWDPLKL